MPQKLIMEAKKYIFIFSRVKLLLQWAPKVYILFRVVGELRQKIATKQVNRPFFSFALHKPYQKLCFRKFWQVHVFYFLHNVKLKVI